MTFQIFTFLQSVVKAFTHRAIGKATRVKNVQIFVVHIGCYACKIRQVNKISKL